MKNITIIILVLLAVAVALGTFETFISQNSGELFLILLISNLMLWAAVIRSVK